VLDFAIIYILLIIEHKGDVSYKKRSPHCCSVVNI